LLDAEGRVLVEHRFDARAVSHSESGTMGFSVFAPWSASARRIALKRKEKVLAERMVSPNTPTVRVLSPNGGESLGTETSILWGASDPDGDPLSYSVFYNLLPEASLVWTSDRDGLIGKGNRVKLKSLSPGTHTLTLTGTDSQGQKATAQVPNLIRRPASK
jgi:hypothetical protein